MNQDTGKYIIIAGIIIVVVGVAVFFFHDAFRWFGKLPGDIAIKKENSSFYFPWVTMLVISVVLTIIINIVRRFL